MANKFKNPLTIVQGNQSSLLGQTVTATGSSATTLIKTPGGSYLNPSSSSAHGYLMADMTNTLLVNLHNCTSWRIILKFKFNSLTTDQYNGLFGSGNYSPFIYKTPSHKISVDLYNNSRTAVGGGSVDYVISSNTWYYVAVRWENGLNIVSLYDEGGTLLGTGYSFACKDFYNTNYNQLYLGGSNNSSWVGRNLEMDISECCYEKDGVSVWGATNAKTENMGVFHFDDWSEYQEVAYLESTGTQYINTGIVPNSNTRVVTKYTASQNPSYNGWMSSGSAETFLWGTSETDYMSFVSKNSQSAHSTVAVDNDLHTFDLQSGSQKLDGVEFGTGEIGDTATSGQTMYLFARHDEWSSSPFFNKSKHGETEIYSGSTKQRHYKPCYHKATGIIGMFDMVNNKLYPNAGTGNFIKGPDVNI